MKNTPTNLEGCRERVNRNSKDHQQVRNARRMKDTEGREELGKRHGQNLEPSTKSNKRQNNHRGIQGTDQRILQKFTDIGGGVKMLPCLDHINKQQQPRREQELMQSRDTWKLNSH